MRKNYRVGVIGRTGHGDYGHGIDMVWEHVDGCQVVAVADDNDAGRNAAAQRLTVSASFADYREMLDKAQLDIVAIGTRWLDRHAEIALAAIERGIHIYMEKPFCRDLVEADAIVRACQMTHVRLALAHTTRYSPKLARVQQLLNEGAIGKVLELRGRGKEDARGGGEDLWVLGSHIMNMMDSIAGAPKWCQASVTVDGRSIEPSDVAPGNEGIGPLAGDSVHALFGFEGGVVGSFDSVRGAAGSPSRFGLVIHGSEGIIEIGTGFLPTVKILRDSSWSPGQSQKAWQDVSSAGIEQPEPIDDSDHHGGNKSAVNDLIEAIEGNREPLCGPEAGRTTVEMILGVFESQVTGQRVELPTTHRPHPLAEWAKGS